MGAVIVGDLEEPGTGRRRRAGRRARRGLRPARGHRGGAGRGAAGDRRADAGGAARRVRRAARRWCAAPRSCASRSPTGSPAWSRACAALGADIEDDRRRLRGARRRQRRCAGGTIDARGDHRLAMLGAVAGLASRGGRRGGGHGGGRGLLSRVRAGPGGAAGVTAQPARRGSGVLTRVRRLVLSPALAACCAAAPAAHATFPAATGGIAAAGTVVERRAGLVLRVAATVDADSRARPLRCASCQRTDGDPRGRRLRRSHYRSPAWSPERRAAWRSTPASRWRLIAPSGQGFRRLRGLRRSSGRRRARLLALGPQLRLRRRRSGSRRDIRRDLRPRRTRRRLAVRRRRSPDWSARGRIAFERGGVVYTVRPSGRRPATGRAAAGTRAGRPPGARSCSRAAGGIYVARADGTRAQPRRALLALPAPAFSPDGKPAGLRRGRPASGADPRRHAPGTLIEDVRGSIRRRVEPGLAAALSASLAGPE